MGRSNPIQFEGNFGFTAYSTETLDLIHYRYTVRLNWLNSIISRRAATHAKPNCKAPYCSLSTRTMMQTECQPANQNRQPDHPLSFQYGAMRRDTGRCFFLLRRSLSSEYARSALSRCFHLSWNPRVPFSWCSRAAQIRL